MTTLRRAVAAALAMVLAGAAVITGATPAAAEDPATLTLTKTAELTDVVPGDTFDFIINVQCTTFASGCTDAQVVDQIPDGLTPTNVSITGSASGTSTINGQEVVVNFTDPLTEPTDTSVGMAAGSNAEIHITVLVDDLPYDANGVPLTNEAIITATNPDTDPASDTATVVPSVDLELSTSVDKAFNPDSAMAVPGTPTDVTINAANTSDEGVTELVVTEPSPPGAGGMFDYFDPTSLSIDSLPADADQVQVDVYVGGAWVTGTPSAIAELPAGVDPTQIEGIRLTFSSSTGGLIQPGEDVQIDLGLEQQDLGAVVDPIDVLNTVESQVDRDGVIATDTGDDTYTLLPNIPDVTAGKTITPEDGPHGDSFNAELTAQNSWSEDLATLSIIEPAAGAAGFDDSMSFDGFLSPPVWPAGATGATITYECQGGGQEGPTSFANGATPPDPTCTPERFRIDFTGAIPPGASATVNVSLGTDPDDPAESTTHTNQVGVEGIDPNGVTGEDDATDDFLTYLAILSSHQDKSIVPGEILGNAGEWIVVELPGGTDPAPTGPPPFPDDTSTVPADQIVIQDPVDPTVGDDFWDAFSPTEIANVAILAGSSLTVNYWNPDTGAWEPLAGPIDGPTTWSFTGPWPDPIGGLQFVFDSDAGFPPGTTLQPNIVFELDDDYTGDDPLQLTNCAQATADADNADPAVSEPGCDDIIIDPLDPGSGNGGTGDYLEKDIVETVVGARTGDPVTVNLGWGTGGVSGVDPMVVSDVPNPTPVADTFYEAFDLVSIDPITPAQDPLIRWDAVARIELYSASAGAWQQPADDPCPLACDGTFPGYTLSPAQQEDTLGVRLIFTEGSQRASTTDPTAPPVGSGVARTFDPDRPITLHFVIRDDRRSDGTPVTGHDSYNEGDPTDNAAGNAEAIIRDDASAVATIDGDTYEDDESDIIVIVDVPLAVGLDKTWTGGPIGDPPEDSTDPADYPSGRVTLTATNLTQARVDSLVVADPGATGLNPFDVFNLTSIVSMQVPSGTESWTATFDLDGGGTLVVDSVPGAPNDVTPLTSLTAAQLEDVVGVNVDYEGRIDPDAQAVLVMDLQLRVFYRSSGASIVAPPDPDALTVDNGADATVDDAGRDPDVLAPIVDDQASIDITELDLSVVAAKAFGPLPAGTDVTVDGFSQTEPDDSPFLMYLAAEPVGSARTGTLVVTDIDPTFWNAYEVVGFDSSFAFTDPIDEVQIDAYTGGTFTEVGGDVVVTGGDWEIGTPGAAPTLPTGVAPEEVQGLRITYERADGGQWENSEAPIQTIPIVVQRRDELLTGGPVPTDMAGNAPAPGETDPGRSTNTIDASATSYLDDSNGQPLFTAESDPVTGSVLYEHAITAVEVEKDPEGTIQPGSNTDFTLTITNTGEWPIIDPVITDYLPVDGDGPMLTLDPFLDEHFSYALAGDPPDPANGLPMPTDPAEVTATPSADGETIQFTFPPGTVLEPGQTYTITIALYPRPGVEAGIDMTNTFGIVGERPWDECVGDPGLDTATDECQAETVVDLGIAGALRSGKLVKADDPSLGVEPADCTPVVDDFYGPPCTPITAPGDTETWLLALQNTGTVPLERIVAIDVLPTVGDTGAINANDRGSQWDPILVDALVDASGPAGSIAVYGTTDDPPCTDDLTPSTPCPDGAWVEVTDATDLTTLTALKYDVELTDPLLPGDFVTLEFQTQTPAASQTDGPDTAAYNSVATGGVTTGGNELLPTEGNRVGVILATGPIEVLKEVTGPGVAFAPDEVTVTVVCTSLGEEVYNETFPLPVGQVVTIEDLPYGATCTMTEQGAGETSVVITDGTVGRDDDPVIGRVTALNTYELADLEVSKLVESDAVDADGNPIVYGPFEVSVVCTFLGDEVWADGYDAGNPMEATLEDGDVFALTGLPAGAECVVTETDSAGAASVTVTMTAGADDAVVTDGDSGIMTLAPDTEGDNTALVTNAYEVGDLMITKDVTGPGADIVGSGPFLFDVVCTLPQPGGDIVTWDGEVELTYPDFTSDTITDIAAGSTCTVTETDAAGADTTTVVPSSVVVEPGQTVEVTATNSFDTGDLVIAKEVTGPGASYAPDAFDVTVTCTANGSTVFEQTYTLDAGNGYTVEILDQIPYGAECVVTEGDFGQTTMTTVPGEAVVGVDPGIDVTNDYQLAGLEVSKLVESDAVDADGNPIVYGPFEVSVVCTFLGDEVWADGYDAGNPMEATLEDGDVFALTGLPAGAECVVTETDSAGAASVTVTMTAGADDAVVTDGDSGTMTLAPDDNTALVTNAYEVGDLTLTKIVDGPGADIVGWGPFLFDVVCTLPQPGGDIVTWDGEVELAYPDGTVVTIEDIAAGSTCTVTETDAAGADQATVTPDTVVIEPGTSVDVMSTNSFVTGDLVIRKAVLGPGAGYAPDSFTVTVECVAENGTTFSGTYVLDESNGYEVAIVDEILYGSECVVTEEEAGQTWTASVPGTAVVGEDDVIGVLNYYALASLDVVKTLDTDALGADGEVPAFGPFTVEVRCEFLGAEVWGDGFDADNPMTGQILADETFTVTGLPAGAECVVTETDAAGAVGTVVTVTAGDVATLADGTSGTLTLVPGGANSVEFTNAFDVGSLAIEKTVTGPGAPTLGAGPFVFAVRCTLDQRSGEIVTWEGDVTLGGGDPLTWSVDTIAAGSECTVVETDDGGADRVTVSPGSVTVGAGADVTVAAENWFDLVIDKTEGLSDTGFDAGPWAAVAALLAGSGAVLLTARRRY